MIWYRVDNRLVHGQVIEAWIPHTGSTLLAVVNDELAENELQQQIMQLAIPARVRTVFIPVKEAPAIAERQLAKKEKTLMLFADCHDAKSAFEAGLPKKIFNVGNLHYSQGKKQICAHVAISAEDEICLKALQAMGITLDFRCVPSDSPQVTEW